MTSHASFEVLQGELERLFDLDELLRLSADVLGFDPNQVGSTGSKGAFARALVGHCAREEAVEALVDAILLTSDAAEPDLRTRVQAAPNGELKPGTRVGNLRVIKKIGEGGLSMVYLAEGESEAGELRRAALKVIRHEYARDRAAVHRFATMARVLQSMDARGLVPILQVGQLEDRRPWVAAQYLSGQTLADRITRTGALHIHEARSILKGVIEGLSALHKRGLVHGDVKTENVFVTRPGADDSRGEPTGVLVDAGADRLVTRTKLGATSTGLLPVLGTAKAIAPEQARGHAPDARSDIYQLGTLLYEVLTGRPPFEGDSAIDVIAQHLSMEPEPPSSSARKGWISTSLDDLVLRALAKDPNDRFQSAQELGEALDRAANRPVAVKALDEGAFQSMRLALRADPQNDQHADRLEELARETGAFARVAEALREGAQGATDLETKLGLLFRAARIYDTDLKETLRAEATYSQIRELDPSNQVALRGIEACKRARGDHAGLVEVLLDRIEREPVSARKTLLLEVAALYEKQLRDPENALIAYTQVLVADPRDAQARKHVEQIAGSNQTRWGEVLEMLTQSAQESHTELFTDEQARQEAARSQLTEAEATLANVRAMIDAQLTARAADAHSTEAAMVAEREAAEQAVRAAEAHKAPYDAALAEVADALEGQTNAAEQQQAAADQARAQAEQAVEAYEALERDLGEGGSDEQRAELERLAGEAEALVEAAEQAEQAANAAIEALETVRANLLQAQANVDAADAHVTAARAALDDLPEIVGEGDGVEPTREERAQIDDAERAVAEAQRALAVFETQDAAERAAERERGLAQLVEVYTLMGRFYGEHLRRPDFALSCFSQAIQIDPSHDGAQDGVCDLYRAAQAWSDLGNALLQRVERAKNPVKAREHRVEAAVLLAHKIGDVDKARSQLERVLQEDPAHPAAQRALSEILSAQEDWPALAETLEKEVAALKGDDQHAALLRLGELYEDQLGDLDRAEVKYRAALAIDARDLTALKGLERIYARKESFDGLLEALSAQVDLAPTPKQRIALLERVGLLYEEEFVDHGQAAKCFEDIISIDATHEVANLALARLYRHLQRFDDLVEALDRHATSSGDPERKVALMLQAAQVLSVDIGSPERAIEVYEEILAIDPEHADALSELARLKSTVGDTRAAVRAVERLAEQEQDPHKQAQLLVRAGRLLAEGGDREGAIGHFKRALDLNPQAIDAAEALREIYAQRGDARGAAEMLVHAIEQTEGGLKRAALLADLGTLYRDRLNEPDAATDAFEQALELDSTNTVAATGLARIAHAAGDHEQAIAHFELAQGRLQDLPVDHAAELCAEIGESYKALGQNDKAIDALKRARDLLPNDIAAALRHAALVMETGDHAAAERLYERLLSELDDRLDVEERVDLMLALGEARLASKRAKQAIETFKDVLDLKPDDPKALDALTRGYRAESNWNEVINLLQLRAKRAATEDEQFDLLVQVGDTFLENVKDTDAASQTYVMALDIKPDNRNLLTKLMGVYSDAQDWTRLIEVILRIAEMVKDPALLAKYYNTAASIAQQELGRFDEAAGYFEASLSYMGPDAGDPQFQGLVQCLTENQDWDRLDRAYEARIERLQEADVEPTRIATLLDARAEVLQHRLGRLADALRYYEHALTLEPDNEARRELLTQLYTREPKRFFQQAVTAHRHYLDRDPYRVDSLQALRKIYTSGKKPDESWCMCQALRCLKMADPDEEKFFKKYRLTRLAKSKQPITDELWRELIVHPGEDPLLTGIFATLQPAVIATHSQPLQAFGVAEHFRLDPMSDPTAIVRMLAHVGDTTTMYLPPIYDAPHDPGGLSFLFASPPGVGIGAGARAGGPQQALAFVAARHLCYYRSGHLLRQLVPTGTGLRAWLIAAIRTVTPRFPAPAAIEEQVRGAVDAISRHLGGPQREALRSLTQRLLEAAPELDMRAWMAAVDLTADRLGFILSNDLKIANAVIEASPEDSASLGRKDRLRELLAYSVSEPYFELRRRTGIALGG